MYAIKVDHIVYTGYRNGETFTLADCWRELDGTGNAKILDGRGRVVLSNAGGTASRRETVRRMYGHMKHKKGLVRHT